VNNVPEDPPEAGAFPLGISPGENHPGNPGNQAQRAVPKEMSLIKI
jgi:hypothetical protein